MAAFAPLIGRNLGLKKVPITFRIEGKKRSGEIPGILHLAVDPLPTAHPSGEMWANSGHPFAPDKLAFAVGASGNTFADHGFSWTILAGTVTTRGSPGQIRRERFLARPH